MDLNNLTPEQQQQVVLLLQQIQAQGSNTNAAEKIASVMQQQASTTLVENIKILAVLKLLSARVQQPSQVAQEQPFVEGPQGLGSNNNAPIGDSSLLLQQILELKQQMINNPNDEGFGLQGQPPQQFSEPEFHNNNNTRPDNGNYRREHNNSPPRWHRDRNRERRGSRDQDRDHNHSPPRRERSPAHHPPSSGRNRPPKWVRDQQRAERGSGTVPTQPPPIGQGAVFTAQNPTEILASYLTDEDVVIPKFSLMQPVITGISNVGNDNNHSGTPKRPRPVSVPQQDTAPQPGNNGNAPPVNRPKGDGLATSIPVPSPVKTSNGPPPMVGKAPPNPKKMPSSPLKGPSTAPPNSSTKLPPPARKGPPLNSPQKTAKVSLEGIPPPYPPPKFPPKQPMHNTPAPIKAPYSQPQPMPPKQYGPKVNSTPPPRTTFPPKQSPQSYPQSKPYQPPSHASHVQHPPYAQQPHHYQHPMQHPPTQPTAQPYYQHPPPQVPNAAPTISPAASSQSRDLFQEATVEDLQQVHQFLTEVLEIQQEAAKDKSRAAVPRVPPPQPGKPAQQVGPALPPQASSYTPPQVKQSLLLNKRPAPTVDTPVAFKKHKTDHYPSTPSPKKAPMTYPPSAQPMPVTPIMAPLAVPPQPMPYPPAAYPPSYQYPYLYPAYDYNAAYQYYYGAAYPPPGVAPTAAPATYPPPGYYPAVPPGYPKK